MVFAVASTVEPAPPLWVFDESDAIAPSPEKTAAAAAVVCDRHRVLLLLAAFAFQVGRSTLWVALMKPPMHTDHAQKSPHDRYRPRATRTVKVAASAAVALGQRGADVCRVRAEHLELWRGSFAIAAIAAAAIPTAAIETAAIAAAAIETAAIANADTATATAAKA
jgi:hypothetical protein